MYTVLYFKRPIIKDNTEIIFLIPHSSSVLSTGEE